MKLSSLPNFYPQKFSSSGLYFHRWLLIAFFFFFIVAHVSGQSLDRDYKEFRERREKMKSASPNVDQSILRVIEGAILAALIRNCPQRKFTDAVCKDAGMWIGRVAFNKLYTISCTFLPAQAAS
ncbi:unnamed protein product [Cylicocyclus nassatus]|uniref:Uncharacterized protein n=1 Tax=Cylicocyclus nassatus TaxID=53992 RepID=A0AA36H1A0_CYLNA|nr:unnamed protein product [Cylicocyclus nassatus]